MAKPRKQPEPAPVIERAPRAPRELPPCEPGNRIFTVEGPDMDATPFGRVTSKWVRWKLIREGKLASVRIGRGVFVTEQAIADFLAKGGSR
jgi:hypothetical protein